MKRADHLLQAVADPDNLRLAFWKASKGKRHSRSVLAYQRHLEHNLAMLRGQILNNRVEVGRYHFFTIFEPKERLICASAFGEQVLHHALMNVCHEYFERVQVTESYASRKNKGVHAALKQAKTFACAYSWYLKLDVRKFFESIHHEVLKAQLTRMFKDRGLLVIFNQIIDSYQAHPNRGLPIGNLTSQYFANHYLAGLDHFIKEQLRIKPYIRYMDDLVLWSKEKDALKNACAAVSDDVKTNLLCDLKPFSLNKSTSGLPFLGFHIFPHYVRLTQQSKQRFIRKMRRLHENYRSGFWNEAQCQRRALPLVDFTRYADAKQLRENVLLFLNGQSS